MCNPRVQKPVHGPCFRRPLPDSHSLVQLRCLPTACALHPAQQQPPSAIPLACLSTLLSGRRALSLCPTAHPKDAEQLVAQACEEHAIQPNATTARTLEKMWAVHEQLYG